MSDTCTLDQPCVPVEIAPEAVPVPVAFGPGWEKESEAAFFADLDKEERLRREYQESDEPAPGPEWYGSAVYLCSGLTSRPLPLSLAAYVPLIEKLAAALDTLLSSLDFDPDTTVPQNCWGPIEAIVALRNAKPVTKPPLESIAELEAQKVPRWQIAKIWKVTEQQIIDELKSPGSVIKDGKSPAVEAANRDDDLRKAKAAVGSGFNLTMAVNRLEVLWRKAMADSV
jgi:hypothetical protein